MQRMMSSLESPLMAVGLALTARKSAWTITLYPSGQALVVGGEKVAESESVVVLGSLLTLSRPRTSLEHWHRIQAGWKAWHARKHI
eukprot:6112829-Prorocentrum_lima.AAC.1